LEKTGFRDDSIPNLGQNLVSGKNISLSEQKKLSPLVLEKQYLFTVFSVYNPLPLGEGEG